MFAVSRESMVCLFHNLAYIKWIVGRGSDRSSTAMPRHTGCGEGSFSSTACTASLKTRSEVSHRPARWRPKRPGQINPVWRKRTALFLDFGCKHLQEPARWGEGDWTALTAPTNPADRELVRNLGKGRLRIRLDHAFEIR